MNIPRITISFDDGCASIGWCALSSQEGMRNPEILGTGVVTFPTDDCLASKRRDLRRTRRHIRRHIRSTRQRIERMKQWLSHRGILSRKDLDAPGHPAPFLLAAAALQGNKTLTAAELWTVLRWYAHNRGYISYLEKHAPDLQLNGSLIRKARIAMDMDWQCPFTGDRYDAYALTKLEREHIIPYATRNTNALHALVLTWPEINRMKGKRSAFQFIEEDGGKKVPNKDNLTILPRKPYENLVGKLKVTGHDDDRRRQKARKALLLTTQLDEKDLGFTDGQLTQTSQLMKLAMRGLIKRFPAARIDPVPGPVTAEIRKGWRLTGTLSLVCPEVLVPNETNRDGSQKVRPKDEIRALTHMHHALDAATLAFIAHYFPLRQHGQDQKGKLWKAMLKRNKSAEEIDLLTRTRLYKQTKRPRPRPDGTIREQADAQLIDLPADLKNALARSLAQARVMQHIPADRSGAKAELTTWGIVRREGTGDASRITLRQNTTVVEEGSRKRNRKERACCLIEADTEKMRGRYARMTGRKARGSLLDEFVEVTGWERKHANKVLLGIKRRRGRRGKRGAPQRYEKAVVEALKTCWLAMEQPRGKRMKDMLPLWGPHLDCPEQTRIQLRKISAASIDRLLKDHKVSARKKIRPPKPACAVRLAVPNEGSIRAIYICKAQWSKPSSSKASPPKKSPPRECRSKSCSGDAVANPGR